MENKFSFAIDIFKKNSGILRMSEAIRQGVPHHIIYEMLAKDIIAREERGLYRLVDGEQLSNPDLVKVSLLVPKGIICLISALYFYRLTTQIPSAVYITLPRNIRIPKSIYLPIDVIRVSNKAYAVGVEEQIVDGVKIKIYSPEKTITDCFRYRSKIGEDVAIEALKDYMKKFRPRIGKIIEYAKINRVDKLIRPYLETLI